MFNIDLELARARAMLNDGHVADALRASAILVTKARANPDARHLLGRSHAMAGRPTDAIREFRAALDLAPRHTAALADLGCTLLQDGQTAEAMKTLRSAVAVDPGEARVQFALGCAALSLGDAATAIEACRSALTLQPKFAEAANGLGAAFVRTGRLDDAISAFRHALRCNPWMPDALSNLGAALLRSGNAAGAIESLQKSLDLRPIDPSTMQDMGAALVAVGRHQDAVEVLSRAVAANPDDPDLANELGAALLLTGRFEDALAPLERALELDARFTEALVNLGEARFRTDRIDRSISTYRRALDLSPLHPQAQHGLGHALLASGDAYAARGYLQFAFDSGAVGSDVALQYADACARCGDRKAELAALQRAVSIWPDDVPIIRALAGRVAAGDEPAAAVTHYERLLQIDPSDTAMAVELGNLQESLGELDRAVMAFRSVLQRQEDDIDALAGLLSCSMRTSDWPLSEASLSRLRELPGGIEAVPPFPLLAVSSDSTEHLRCARWWATHSSKDVQSLPAQCPPTGKKIRLAYVSPDFRDHPVANLLAPLIELHDRARFEVIGIALKPADSSELGHRIRTAFDEVHDIHTLDDTRAAAHLRRLDIDIAVDVAGFTTGHRSGVLAARPARVQVNYLGFPGTMGAPYIDYIVSDPTVIPEHAFNDFSERVVWLPDAYQVNHPQTTDEAVPDRATLGLPANGFVFCCFNNTFKITSEVYAAWMRMLHAVPGSVLWLASDREDARSNLRAQALQHGVDAERIVFAPRVARREAHLARYRRADLFLDTMPFNAHATASDALWCDLPVLTCVGSTFAGRVAVSLLQQVGLEELACPDLDSYVAVATELARDPHRLHQLRQRLDINRRTSTLFDPDAFRRNVESAYVTMWQRWCDGLPPQHFRVTP